MADRFNQFQGQGYAGIPPGPLSAYLGVQAANQGKDMETLQGAGMVQGLLAKMQAQQEMEQIKQVLPQAEGDPAKAIPLLLKIGTPGALKVAEGLHSLMPKPPEPFNLGKDDTRYGPTGNVIATGQPGVMIDHSFSVNGPSGEPMVQTHISRDRGVTWQPALGSSPSPKFARQVAPTTTIESPVQTHTDAKGQLWELPRGGAWRLAKDESGNPITSRAPRDPRAEQLYKDYANHPEVKAAGELEAKMQPLADYMIQFKKTGQSVNANDAALAKAYLAATTSLGNRAYAIDKRELASLPNLGDRLGNMASSFFAGKDLTDQTRTEMFNYIVQRYKGLDAARHQHRTLITKRAQAGQVPIDQIFGGE